jgi:hypothetical protein
MGLFRELRKVTGGVAGAVEDVASGLGGAAKDFLSSPVGQIAMAYYAPVLGEAIGATMFASEVAAGAMTAAQATAIGTGLASTGIQVANGVPLEDALKTSTATAAVSYGSPEAAKYINEQIAKPEVANALASVGGSVVKTAALGGNMDDVIKNAGAALAASGTESLTQDRMIGSAVGGAITGGAMGAATGAAGALGGEAAKTSGQAPVEDVTPTPVATAPEVLPTPVAEAPAPAPVAEAPPPPVDPVQQYNESIAKGIIPVNVVQDIQVAAADGTLPPDQTKLGLNQFKTGNYFTAPEADGSLRSVPVIVDSQGKVYSATGSAADVDFLVRNNIATLTVDAAGINPIFTDKSPINPNLSAEELQALKNVTGTRVEIAQKFPDFANLLKTYGSLDVAETAIGLDALMKTPGVREAMNAGYIRDLEAGLAKDPTYAPYLEEYKKVTGRDYSPAASNIPSYDLGTIDIVGQKLKDVTQPYTPSVIVPDASLVINVDDKTGKALVMDSQGRVTVVDSTPDIKKDQYVTVDPTTNKAKAAKPLPTVSGATFTPFVEDTGTVTKGQAKTETPISSIPTPPAYAGDITDKPSTPAKTTTPTTTTPESPELPPVEDRTGKSTYKPELFIYGGQYPGALSRALGTDLQAQGAATPTTGLTSYRGAGEIESGPGIERQNVWNEASLRLKDALGV